MATAPIFDTNPNPANPVLEIELLLYFAAVAEELSFTKAAKRLGIDQSWLSHKIRQIEARVGMPLFYRSTRHVELTAAGRKLQGPARRLAEVAMKGRQAAEMIRQGIDGMLKIGALPFSFSDPQRIDLTARFLQAYPQTRLTIINGPSPTLIRKLRDGELDMAFVSAPFDIAGLDSIHLRRDYHVLIVPEDDELAGKEKIEFADLAGRRLVVPSERFNPDTFARYYRPFVEAGAVPIHPPEFESAASYALRWRIAAVCSSCASANVAAKGFVAIPIAAGNSFACDKYLVRFNTEQTGSAGSFWDYVRDNVTLSAKQGGRRRASGTTMLQ